MLLRNGLAKTVRNGKLNVLASSLPTAGRDPETALWSSCRSVALNRVDGTPHESQQEPSKSIGGQHSPHAPEHQRDREGDSQARPHAACEHPGPEIGRVRAGPVQNPSSMNRSAHHRSGLRQAWRLACTRVAPVHMTTVKGIGLIRLPPFTQATEGREVPRLSGCAPSVRTLFFGWLRCRTSAGRPILPGPSSPGSPGC